MPNLDSINSTPSQRRFQPDREAKFDKDIPQGREDNNLEELLQDAALKAEGQQQLQQVAAGLQPLPDQNQENEGNQDIAAEEEGGGDEEQEQGGEEDEEDDDSSSLSGSSSSSSSFEEVDSPSFSDDDEMAGTKIGIPKFTGQETDVSDKAKDCLTGLRRTSLRKE